MFIFIIGNRLGGANRYDTNTIVIERFYRSILNLKNMNSIIESGGGISKTAINLLKSALK